MQAIIKYDLTSEEDKIAFAQAIISDELVLALTYLSRRLPNKMKEKQENEYSEESEDFHEGYDEAITDVAMVITETLERFNINLNQLEK